VPGKDTGEDDSEDIQTCDGSSSNGGVRECGGGMHVSHE
jgi:hypothetical protein